MEDTESSANQKPTETVVQQQVAQTNSKLHVIVVISVLVTAMVTGLTVYFWQRSTNEKTIGVLEQGIISLEEQIAAIKYEEITPRPISSPALSLTPPTDLRVSQKTYIDANGEYLVEYPSEWKLEARCSQYGYVCFTSPGFEESPAGIIGEPPQRGGLIWIDLRKVEFLYAGGFCDSSNEEYMAGCEKVTVDQRDGWQREVENTIQAQVNVIVDGQRKSTLTIRAISSDEYKNEIKKIFNQVLSTFKFTI